MRFDASYGLNPREETDRLVTIERSGKPYTLTIGTKALGTHKWVISSLDISYLTVDHKGVVLVAEAEIELKEYAL
jgi:hypothetical protein